MKFFDKLNTPRAVIVMLVLFLVVNGFLYYLYQQRLAKPPGYSLIESPSVAGSMSPGVISSFKAAVTPRPAAASSAEKTSDGADHPDGGDADILGALEPVSASAPAYQSPAYEEPAGIAPKVAVGRWAAAAAVQRPAEAAWQWAAEVVEAAWRWVPGTFWEWLASASPQDDGATASDNAFQDDDSTTYDTTTSGGSTTQPAGQENTQATSAQATAQEESAKDTTEPSPPNEPQPKQQSSSGQSEQQSGSGQQGQQSSGGQSERQSGGGQPKQADGGQPKQADGGQQGQQSGGGQQK